MRYVLTMMVLIVLFPLAVPLAWFAVIFAPAWITLGVGLISVISIFQIFVESIEKSRVSDPAILAPVGVSAGSQSYLKHMLEVHASKLPFPFLVCACVKIGRSQARLVVRILAGSGAWSHQTHGASLEQAIDRLQSRLSRSLETITADPTLSRCGLGASRAPLCRMCLNSARCPLRKEIKSSYQELVHIDQWRPQQQLILG